MINEKNTNTVTPDYSKEVTQLLKGGLSPKAMQDQLYSYHEKDIAEALPLLTRKERIKLYSLMETDTLSEVMEYSEAMGLYLQELPLKKRMRIISAMDTTAIVEYIRTLNASERNTILDLLDDETESEIRLLASYNEDEIGSRMTTNYISVLSSCNIRQAMSELVAQAAENDNVSIIYVTDADGTFYGAVPLKDLIIARAESSICDITITSFPYIYADELTEQCIDRIKSYAEDSLPILNTANRLIGVITAAGVSDLIDEELSEDYARLAGLSSEEDLNEPLKQSVVKRLPWLVALLALGMVVSGVVGAFEKVIATVTIVVYFQSLILDMAGNVGTQSLAITIRVLMDENLSTAQKMELVAKEGKVGLCNGIILGSLSFVCIGLYLWLFKSQPVKMAFAVSGCTGVALVIAMFLSSISGTIIPIVLKKLKMDPAVASGPLITTVNDLVAVTAYYGLAWLLLINILHI